MLQAIENAKPLLSEKDLYTVESFTAFEAAYQEAEKALKDANSTQEDLDKAADALVNTQKALVKVDKDPSDKPSVDHSDDVGTGDYTNLTVAFTVLGISAIGGYILYRKRKAMTNQE